MIILGRLFYISQMIVSGCAQEIADRDVWQVFGAKLRRLDYDRIVLILICRHREIAIGFAQIRLQLHCPNQFLLSFRKFLLLQKRAPEGVMQSRIIRICSKQRAI